MKRALIALAFCLPTPALASPASEKLDLATRLVAMSAFVDTYCSGMKPNLFLVNAALERLGVSVETIKGNKARVAQAELMIAVMKKAGTAGCNRIWDLFGDEGTSVSGLIEKQ